MPPSEQNNIEPEVKKSYIKIVSLVIVSLIIIIGIIYFFTSNSSNVVKKAKVTNPAPEVLTVIEKTLPCDEFKNLLSIYDMNNILGVGAASLIKDPVTLSNGKMDCSVAWKNENLNGSYTIFYNGLSMGDKVLSILGNECNKVNIGSKSLLGSVVTRKIDISGLGDKTACLIEDDLNKSVYYVKNIGVLQNDPLLFTDQQVSRFYPLSVSVDPKYSDTQLIDLAKLLFTRLNTKLAK
jgi:hypothetical protein